MYWSLLDNFERTSGYVEQFSMVALDLETFKRALKPSALHLGKFVKANAI